MAQAPRFTDYSGHVQPAAAVLVVDAAGDAVPLQSAPTLAAGTDRSGSIAAAGASQQLAASNASRRGLRIQNISAEALWVNQTGGAAAASTAGSFKIAVDGTFEVTTSQAVSIVGATLGSKFSATEV